MNIEFQRNTKRVKSLTREIVRDEIEIRLSGVGYFGGMDDYGVGVSIKVNVKSPDSRDDLIIFPDSVIAWFTDTEMTLRRKKCTDLADGRDTKEFGYSCEYGWQCNPKQNLMVLYQDGNLESNFLKFYFGNMLWYKGRKVPLDTIYASDPKANRLKDEIKRYLDRWPTIHGG